MDVGVNFVNAPVLARERGLKLFETTAEESIFFHSEVAVRATGAGDVSREVAGTVFGRTPRIVRVDRMHLDLDPKGPILITRHEDKPGVVGLLGTVLGAHGVNIRRIELGPPAEGGPGADGLATGFLALYAEPSAAVLEHLRGLEPVREAALVRL